MMNEVKVLAQQIKAFEGRLKRQLPQVDCLSLIISNDGSLNLEIVFKVGATFEGWLEGMLMQNKVWLYCSNQAELEARMVEDVSDTRLRIVDAANNGLGNLPDELAART